MDGIAASLCSVRPVRRRSAGARSSHEVLGGLGTAKSPTRSLFKPFNVNKQHGDVDVYTVLKGSRSDSERIAASPPVPTKKTSGAPGRSSRHRHGSRLAHLKFGVLHRYEPSTCSTRIQYRDIAVSFSSASAITADTRFLVLLVSDFWRRPRIPIRANIISVQSRPKSRLSRQLEGLSQKTHRIWTRSAAPSSHPMSSP